MIDPVKWWAKFAQREAGYDGPSLRTMLAGAEAYLAEMAATRACMTRKLVKESGWDDLFADDLRAAEEVREGITRRLAILAQPMRRLRCTCCGGDFQGRQWWNQDTGHGLGPCCEAFATRNMSGDEALSTYGARGFHRPPPD